MAWALSPCPEADDISTGELLSTFNKKNKIKHSSYHNGTDRNRKRIRHNAENKQSLVSKEHVGAEVKHLVFGILCFLGASMSHLTPNLKITMVIFVGKKLLVSVTNTWFSQTSW